MYIYMMVLQRLYYACLCKDTNLAAYGAVCWMKQLLQEVALF